MAAAKKSPVEKVKEAIMALPEQPAKGQYVGTGYPRWQHTGKPCTIVERRGTTGMYVKFDGDDALYLLHVNDVVVK